MAEYLDHADEQMCLLVQVENLEGLANLDAIAAVEGVDGVFIGPADLSAAMGHRGNPGHPEVQAAIEDAIRRIRAAGKAAGILSADEELARRYLELGCAFVAVGVDTSLLMRCCASWRALRGARGAVRQFLGLRLRRARSRSGRGARSALRQVSASVRGVCLASAEQWSRLDRRAAVEHACPPAP